ncbi:TPA: hypothetical protein N0F65_011121 [Lagenidium giganteum]|uniref:Peroxisomal biogenesis factor 3 n=1 Tax=Lagenidium giganteum TaxID=4803 RepID=A0AAV2ZAY3_9STRA|nr:TPA: hypothetical protein N0F65_011121 [Lagenidium giganteum]
MWSSLMHGKERVCGFVRRHRKLVVATGVTAVCGAGVYYAYRRVMGEAERFTQQLQRQMAEHQRLQLSVASTTEESNATIHRFLPKLRKTLFALVNLEEIVAALKALPKAQRAKRNELWEDAKITAVTRYFTALIAFGVWHLLVFAQISIIGKRTFERSKDKDKDKAAGRSNDEAADAARMAAQHAFLASGLEYFLDEGLERIKKHVEQAVVANEQLQSWEVNSKLKVDREELNDLLQSIYLSIVPSTSVAGTAIDEEDDAKWAMWRSFLIYSEKKAGQDEEVISLLNDLWDLLDSELFPPALQQSLAFLCGNAFQDLNEHVYGYTEHKMLVEDVTNEQDTAKKAPPLAKLIPMLQTEIGKLLTATNASDGQPSYSRKYSQGLGELEAFRNFYEAIFFQHADEGDVISQFI